MDLVLVYYNNPKQRKSNIVWKRNKGIKEGHKREQRDMGDNGGVNCK